MTNSLTIGLPQRIQRKRTKGWKMPDNTICVTRGSRWGNPFEAEYFGLALCLELFKNSLMGVWNPSTMKGNDDAAVDRAYKAHHEFHKKINGHPLDRAKSELRGKNLACWCKLGEPCHADILLKAVNRDCRSEYRETK